LPTCPVLSTYRDQPGRNRHVEGKLQDRSEAVRKEVFRHGKAINDQALASALLARILLLQGRSAEALAMAERALSVSTNADASVRLSVAVTAARIRLGADRKSIAQVVANLKSTIATARKFGYFGTELEARLMLGEIEMKSGAVTRGRVQLRAVKKDASDRGFVVLARKAASSSS
jgi:hypothetical protein